MDGNLFHTPDDSYPVHVVLSLPYSLLSELNGCLSYGAREESWLQVGNLTPVQCAEHFDRIIMEKSMLTGSIIAWFGQDIPEWGLLCDGTQYERDEYPALWSVIVDHFKTSTHFTVPNMDRVFLLAVNNSNDVGEEGGNAEVTIETGHMPPHTHTTDSMAGIVNGGALASLPVHIPGASITGSSGSGVPLDVTNPYISVRMVIVK